MLAIIRSRIFCLPVCYQTTERLRYAELEFLSFVLYGCETWSLTLTEGRRLRMFENMVRRKIVGPKRDEVTGE
jgi:hypothetical protein